jgi:hypothetical protein
MIFESCIRRSRQGNPDTWTVKRDPAGNEFCVASSATLTGWT